jgi:CHAT domain-containing protein
VLVYLCGDNHIEKYTDEYLRRLLTANRCRNLHLVVQHDTSRETKRYVVEIGRQSSARRDRTVEQVFQQDVNTGDPRTLAEFLDWALATVSAEHHVLILSGLGINPRYLRQSLPLEKLPQPLQGIRHERSDGGSADRKFARAVERLEPNERAKYRELIHRDLFSICHDFGESDALAITELRKVLIQAVNKLGKVKTDPRFDLIVFDVGGAAFVEVLFELDGLARAFVGSRHVIPDRGWPYDKLLLAWDQTVAGLDKAGHNKSGDLFEPIGHHLAKTFLQTVHDSGDEFEGVVAVNLDALDEVARSLDTLAIALLHSLGDWHVLDAFSQAIRQVDHVSVSERGTTKGDRQSHTVLDDIEFLPGASLFQLLESLEAAFSDKLRATSDADAVPARFGQHDRIQKLYRLTCKTISHLRSDKLVRRGLSAGSLFLSDRDNSEPGLGLSILLPPLRAPQQIQDETGKIFSLSHPSYANLNFSRRVHWAALVGAIQMIHEKPHALWRVISSMLADASSPARDAALGRLISRRSVISELRDQFQSLGESESLTLSLEPQPNPTDRSDLARYLVRLEPSLSGGVVYQQESRVYTSSLEAILRDLQDLLQDSRPSRELEQRLRSLGESLGEDLIQDLVAALETERGSSSVFRGETPHLQLQMPRWLMRYPWELMHDRDGMLCERYALGRQVFMEGQFVRPIPRRATNVVRVLVIGDPEYTRQFQEQLESRGWSPSRLPHAAVEAQKVAGTFQRLHDEMSGVVQFNVTALIGQRVSMNDMRMFLREGRFDLIHYAGHAFFDKQDPDGSAWVLSDGLLHAREIRNTLAWTSAPPWLVFANACEAGMDVSEANRPTDVSGLATAFINQGVAAYIAPLWPVDDEVARWLAVGFYRELMRERFSVGEALRRARVAIWDNLRDSEATQAMPARTALTWSSFVLYGDPTSRLLQSLWTPAHGDDRAAGVRKREATIMTATLPQSRFRLATTGQIGEAVDFPASLALPIEPHRGFDLSAGVERGIQPVALGDLRIELVERDGVRYWRSSSSDPRIGTKIFSNLGSLLDDPKRAEASPTCQMLRSLVGQERGLLDVARVVKAWVIKKITGTAEESLITELAAQFDRQQVIEEGLIRYLSPNERRRLRADGEYTDDGRNVGHGEWLRQSRLSGQKDRVLLFVHGTFSNCHPAIEEFTRRPANQGSAAAEKEVLLNWMLRRYRAVLGFDHWTLSKTPAVNAELLLSQLVNQWQAAGQPGKSFNLDIICHSRGGLVAQALIELSRSTSIKFHRAIFVGVPNAGTNLANPANWGQAADVLVNLVSEDPTGLFGRLASFLIYLLANGLMGEVPGLQAMNPLIVAGNKTDATTKRAAGSRTRSGPDYHVVAANYVPRSESPNLFSILPMLFREAGDQLVDSFFAAPNDLVVDTASMWAFDGTADWSSNVTTISPENMLLFNTERGGPGNVQPVVRTGVHHVNYFSIPEVRRFLRETLDPG